MLPWKKSFTSLRSNFIKKRSQVSSLMACSLIGQPVWTPVRYDALAEQGYQKNVIVYRAITLIARSVASVPLLLYEGKEKAEAHPLLSLLDQPNPAQGGNAFMEALLSHLLLSGNSYIEAVISEREQSPRELYILRPDRIRVIPNSQGVPQAYEYMVGGYTKRISVDGLNGKSSLLHMKFFHPLHDWYGLSPLEAALKAIDLHNTVAGHNLALLQNGGRPSGALLVKPDQSGMTLTEEQRQQLREDLKEIYEGTRNAGKIMMLEGDFEWKEMGLSPKDLDFIEGKNLSAREISQVFGVPPMLVGVPGDATFANYREARLHLWEDTILPLLDMVVNDLNHWLLPQFGADLKLSYDVDNIPALAPKREAQWQKINSCSFLTINEKRAAVGYGPLSRGDIL